MKTSIKLLAATGLASLLVGCETTGLSSREHSGASYPNYIFALEIRGTNAPLHNPSLPVRLAVAQVGETAPSTALLEKLTGQKKLIASVDGLPLPGDAENYSYSHRVNNSVVDYSVRVKTVCHLARSAGADYVFLFGGNIDSWQKNNSFSILDATLVGGVFIPGCQINLEGKGAGVLIEVATAEPVFFVSVDNKLSASSPDFLASGKTEEMRSQVRDELVQKLGDEFLRKLAETDGAMAAANK